MVVFIQYISDLKGSCYSKDALGKSDKFRTCGKLWDKILTYSWPTFLHFSHRAIGLQGFWNAGIHLSCLSVSNSLRVSSLAGVLCSDKIASLKTHILSEFLEPQIRCTNLKRAFYTQVWVNNSFFTLHSTVVIGNKMTRVLLDVLMFCAALVSTFISSSPPECHRMALLIHLPRFYILLTPEIWL